MLYTILKFIEINKISYLCNIPLGTSLQINVNRENYTKCVFRKKHGVKDNKKQNKIVRNNVYWKV